MTDRPNSWSTDEAGSPLGPPGGGAGAPPLVPPPPPPPKVPDRDGPPWERRAGIMDLGAMLATVRDVLFDAPATFGRMVREGGLAGPILFLLILGTVCGWIGMAWDVVLSGATSGMGDFGQVPPEFRQYMEMAESPAVRVAQALILPAILLVIYFVMSGVLHLMLLLVGGAHQSFETTARVAAYTMGATAVFDLIPICGPFIGALWAVVVLIIGLTHAHETGAGRAVAAVLLPLALCCLCCVGVAVALGIGLAGMAGG